MNQSIGDSNSIIEVGGIDVQIGLQEILYESFSNDTTTLRPICHKKTPTWLIETLEGKPITKGKSHKALMTQSIFEPPFIMKETLFGPIAKFWNEVIKSKL